jgi:hypothetical protein
MPHDISKQQAMSPKINGEICMNTYEIEVNDVEVGSAEGSEALPPPEDDPNLVITPSPDPPSSPPSGSPTL